MQVGLFIHMLLLLCSHIAPNPTPSQEIVGTWKTVDDKTGEEKAYVEIYQEDGLFYARIMDIFNKEKRDLLCTECPGDQKNEPMVGLLIMKDLERVDAYSYHCGKVLWPEQGKWYDLHVEVVDGSVLLLKGGYKVFGGVVGRKQTWYRVE